MRGVERAAAYVPTGAIDRRPRAADDEDGFTLAATALERLEPPLPGGPPPARLLLVGDLPASADADLVRFLGFPLRTDRFGRGGSALGTALEAACDAARGGEPALLVAVDLAASRAGTEPVNGDDGFDAAVALRFAELGNRDGEEALGDVPRDGPQSTPGLLELGRRRRATDPDRWVGDFEAPPPRAAAARTAPAPAPASEGPFSQGAYVPRPRYLENLPGRWRLIGERCSACGRIGFPPRGRCRECGATEGLVPTPLPRDGGEVVAATTIGPGGQPTEFDDQVAASGPYSVVLVELVPGVRVTLQATDARPGELAIGARVGTRLRRLYRMEGEWRYGRKAVPLR